jgi:hypothetical protein
MNSVRAKAGKHVDYWTNYKDNIKMDPKEVGYEDVKGVFLG